MSWAFQTASLIRVVIFLVIFVAGFPEAIRA
jgi:hypothetical protein